ncbi:hypothetical protein AB0H76_13180 [Nocardia sp. NPDC050712]|uniref:hypothetical protein n=1 Tax=Nocardia sp. NPDC050712 TaxID=3155518 RepID=UPI0033EC7351
MFAGLARSAAVTAIAVPLVVFAAPAAFADEPAATPGRHAVSKADQPLRKNVDAPYIWVNICVHIPTPGSATLDWCWP